MTVYSTKTDPLFTHVMPPKARSLYATPTHDTTHHFKVSRRHLDSDYGTRLPKQLLTKLSVAVTHVLQAVMIANSPEDAEALMHAIQASEGNYDEVATESVGALAEGIRVALMHDMVRTCPHSA